MQVPYNKKVTFNSVTYRGGDELPSDAPKEALDRIGIEKPIAAKKKVVKKESEVKDG